ncbi:MAG: T9SS type A sorting domain-containing protein [Chitinophagales bacterium]|nr:T9SS type A sorting domain-containing protein [Chitinophagales bacterium]
MKTLILTSALLLAVILGRAQYCGNSGALVCTPSGSLMFPSIFEESPCFTRMVSAFEVIHIKNYDSVFVGNQLRKVVTLQINSISNLPFGLCWATNKANNTFNNGENGCIRISGTPNDDYGQYRLTLLATVTTTDTGAVFPNVELNPMVRLKSTFDSICPPVNINQTAAFDPYNNISSVYALISGRVYYDMNNDFIYNAGDFDVKNQVIDIGNGVAYPITGTNGVFYTYISPGQYTVLPAQNSIATEYGFNPDTLLANAFVPGYSYGGFDFALTPPPNLICKGNVSVTPDNPPPRPGFTNGVQVQLQHVLSAQPMNGTLRVNYPPQQTFVLSNPPATLVDSVQHFIEVAVTNLNPGSSLNVHLILQTPPPPAVPLGTLFTYSAQLSGTGCIGFDTLQATETATVVGSYDPNDKAVSPVGESNAHVVQPNTTLTYTIRFQNTGTFYAQNVVVVDTISTHLDMSTLRVLATSHTYEIAVEQNRAVKFIFNNIMLPDSFTNEPESHGYIKYSIKPNSNVSNGTLVTNRADIYFDFNPPILTNTVYNTLDNTLSIQSVGGASTLLKVYPNPNQQGVWYVRCEATLLNQSMKVLDMSGRLIHEQQLINTEQQLQLPDLMPGMYLLQAGEWTGKLLKQ